jgi:hypothetical protein
MTWIESYVLITRTSIDQQRSEKTFNLQGAERLVWQQGAWQHREAASAVRSAPHG